LTQLARLPFRDLTLYQCPKVTDRGLEVLLVGCEDLARLTLRDVGARGAALSELPQPEKLVSLNLAQTPFADDAVPNLLPMTGLERLDLHETKITDEAVETLSKLKSLKHLSVAQTRLSDQAIARLRNALPACMVQAN